MTIRVNTPACAGRGPWRRWHAGLLVGWVVLLSGCANWSYDRLQIGMSRPQAEQLLPTDGFQRTDQGYCCSTDESAGRAETLVVLLGSDGRVAGKLQATGSNSVDWWQRSAGFRLRGEVDPARLNLAGTGPLDTLRAITHDLLTCPGAQSTRTAHARVAAGLLRLVQRWPLAGELPPQCPELAEALQRIPAGGGARISLDSSGVYSFEYVHGAAP